MTHRPRPKTRILPAVACLAALLTSGCGTPTPLQTTGIKACDQLATQIGQGASLSADALRQRWGEPWRRMQVRNFEGAIWEYRFMNAGTLWGCYGYVNPAGQVVKVDDMQIYFGDPRT
jgi:hypothetical protein